MYSVIPSCCIRIVGVAWDDRTDIGLLPRVDTSTMLFRSITKIHITASDTMTPQPTLYSQQVVVVNNILSPSLTKDISRQLWPRNLCRAISNVFRLSEYLPCQYSMIHSCSSSWLLIITPCTDSLDALQYRSWKGQSSPVGFYVDFGTKKTTIHFPQITKSESTTKCTSMVMDAAMMIDAAARWMLDISMTIYI